MRTLYSIWLHPASRKIMFFLSEKKLDYKVQTEKPWKPSAALQTFTYIPILPVLHDLKDQVVVGNYAICEYLEEAYPSPTLIGSTLKEKNEVRKLTVTFEEHFQNEVINFILYEKVFKRYYHSQTYPDSARIRQGKDNLYPFLKLISYWVERRNWLAGNNFSLADITAASYLSCIDYLGDIPWTKFPEAKDWYARVKSRPSFQPLLNEKVPGLSPVPHYHDPDF